ncbi:MAG: hypothetical protein ACYC63_13595 [Armatimonadota bacterium]
MECSQYQFLIGTEEEVALASNAALQEHLKTCGDCAKFSEEMRALSSALAAVPPLATPATFSEGVSSRLRETEEPAAPSPALLRRLLGPLQAPAPTLEARHAIASVALILVAVMIVTVLVYPLAANPATAGPTLPSASQPDVRQPAGSVPMAREGLVPPRGGTLP